MKLKTKKEKTMDKKKKTAETGLIPQNTIESKILLIRGKKVMLDTDLAELYGVETRQLTRQVRRNIERFPDDFMFQLTRKELMNLKCQFGTSSWGGTRKLPYVFTDYGILMLSSVLNSNRAIQVNIAIMRVFGKLNKIMPIHQGLLHKIKELEKKVEQHEKDINTIFDAG